MTSYTQCTRCVLDTINDPGISFDNMGVCNYCHEYDLKVVSSMFRGEEGQRKLFAIAEKIKTEGKSRDYDCIIGLSGGVDSTYVAWYARKLGLRPLVVHVDNGWNSELAIKNIENIVNKLGFDLFTYVINWGEFRDIQLSFLKASVVDIELITDHAINATVVKQALKHKVKYVLSGINTATEGILPSSWTHRKSDWLNIKSIHKKYGKLPLKTYPHMAFSQSLYLHYFHKIETIAVLNYVDYNKDEAKKVITAELGWRDYGGKHYESVFTRFYQAYILPVKFGIDKRKAHYSTLINAGQMTLSEALAALMEPTCNPVMMKEDKQYVVKKLGMSEEEFDLLMKEPQRPHLDFPSYVTRHWSWYAKLAGALKPILKLFKKSKTNSSQ